MDGDVGLTGAMQGHDGVASYSWLGGLDPIPDFNPLLQMASGVYLTFFGSFVFGKPGFPLSDVPLQAIAADVEAGRYKSKPSRVFRFADIQAAHRVMASHQSKGEIVVLLVALRKLT